MTRLLPAGAMGVSYNQANFAIESQPDTYYYTYQLRTGPLSSYAGTITTTGKSEAIRLEEGIVQSRFRQKAKVRADVIGPGTCAGLRGRCDQSGQRR